MENKDIKFLDLSFETEEQEEMYLKSKTYILETLNKYEKSVEMIAKSLAENNSILNEFEKLLELSNDEETKTTKQDIITNLTKSRDDLTKNLDVFKGYVDTLNVIVEDCFTEKVENDLAIPSEKGKCFSTYFSLFLDVINK